MIQKPLVGSLSMYVLVLNHITKPFIDLMKAALIKLNECVSDTKLSEWDESDWYDSTTHENIFYNSLKLNSVSQDYEKKK